MRKEQLNIKDQGVPSDYVGVNVSQREETFTFTQRALTEQVIKDIGLKPNCAIKHTPMTAKKLL